MTQAQQPMSFVELDGKDLPAYCPNPAMPVWSAHPRVYLPIEANGEGKCPYCGTIYKVKPGTHAHGH
ncbi:zinc-finger domain-containing protein [Noviherbaspirillum aridicola]|uniref:Zinc-finger domain-containing protein n=1 Tax=Noviherbaspirillum aridicola TaxID=2849687 RepID=A0ABQ4Q8U1_9BURK|nr:zinc-finger domain-containing protein [Noviherbaspirillum aridicola]GIZ53200.1 zinc-finger domain-containing protein [Noviherbaspirillum aridicola]